MATKSTFERMKHVEALIEKYRERRKQLKEAGDYAALARLPRNSSPTRLRNICAITGRSRAVYQKFRISRIMLRKLALEGKIPGMRKASW